MAFREATNNNTLIQLIRFLLLIIGCQHANANIFSSSTSSISGNAGMAMEKSNATVNGDQSVMMQMFWQMGKEIGKMEIKMDGMKKEIEGLKEELGGKIQEIDVMKKAIEKLQSAKDEVNRTVELPITEGTDELEIIITKNNKLNATDCGPKLTISEGGLIANHSGPDEDNCVRAIWPIPPINLRNNKPTIDFYFEIEIHTIKSQKDYSSIGIGFCWQEFQLEGGGWLGNENNSIGIWRKGKIFINGSKTIFGNATDDNDDDFKERDVIGIGIAHQPYSSLECFATCNGELLGKAALPPKFFVHELFPAVNLEHVGESVRAIFEKDKWNFKNFELIFK